MTYKPFTPEDREDFLSNLFAIVREHTYENNINHPEDIMAEVLFTGDVLASYIKKIRYA